MNFFKIKTNWSNAEFIVLKLCIASAYILIGAWFSDFILCYYVPFVVLFGITVVWAVALWLKKMKTSKS
jgi:hypothetical protein